LSGYPGYAGVGKMAHHGKLVSPVFNGALLRRCLTARRSHLLNV
jgi:hypothetical protein